MSSAHGAIHDEDLLGRGLAAPHHIEIGRKIQRAHQRFGRTETLYDILDRHNFVSHTAKAQAGASDPNAGATGEALRASVSRSAVAALGCYLVGLERGLLTYAALCELDADLAGRLVEVVRGAGFRVERAVFHPLDRRALQQRLRRETMAADDVGMLVEQFAHEPENASFVPRLVEAMMIEAIDARASDIHLLVSRNFEGNWIAYRVDGELQYRHILLPEVMRPLATRIKADAGIDAIDIDKEQDGRFTRNWRGREIDFRVASMPVEDGEKVALRILDSSALIPLDLLLLDWPDLLARVRRVLGYDGKRGGIIKLSGPTGSGKSTTMYSMMAAIDRSHKNVCSAESPVEYKMPLVHQVPVHERGARTFETAIRHFLRQDPDVIVVGETRDPGTAVAEVHATESGHLVLGTIHANNSIQTIDRFIGLLPDGMKQNGANVIAEQMQVVINQQLMKRVCLVCRQKVTLAEARVRFDLPPLLSRHAPDDTVLSLAQPAEGTAEDACQHCGGTGFHGRILIPEYLIMPQGALAARRAAQHIMDRQTTRILDIDGVRYQSRHQALLSVVCRGIIDLLAFRKAFADAADLSGTIVDGVEVAP